MSRRPAIVVKYARLYWKIVMSYLWICDSVKSTFKICKHHKTNTVK